MRKPLIAGNWKMNNSIAEACTYATEISPLIKDAVAANKCDVLVCPALTALYTMNGKLEELASDLILGAQNVYWEENGAFTGEVSPVMLNECGVKYVIVGHSERRMLFSEGTGFISKKAEAALAHGMTPIVCCGESLSIYEGGLTKEWIEAQLLDSLVFWDGKADIVIAYEPIWAIGTGKTATAQIAETVCEYIREWIEDNYSEEAAEQTRILYGGSVKGSNIAELMAQTDIDGVLVGGASVKAADFAEIVNNF